MVKMFRPPLLEFGAGESNDPIHAYALQKDTPYKIPLAIQNGFEIIPISPQKGDYSQHLNTLLSGFISGTMNASYPRNKFPGFANAFRTSIKVDPMKIYNNENELFNNILDVAKERDLEKSILAIAIPNYTAGCGLYQRTKIKCIESGIRSQIFTGPNLEKYNNYKEDERGQYIWNVGFAIFSKMEGIPWKLKESLQGVRTVIGMHTVVKQVGDKYERVGITSLQVWNDWGSYMNTFNIYHHGIKRERGQLSGITEGELADILVPALNTTDGTEKADKKIIIHTSDIYAREVYSNIAKALQNTTPAPFKILRVKNKSSHFSYDPSKSNLRQAWPETGTWNFISSGRRAYLYTQGAWKYYPTRDPYVITEKHVTPIEIIFVFGSKDERLEESDIHDVYKLTRLAYYTGDVIRVRQPITIKLGRAGTKLVQCGLTSFNRPISFLY